MKYAMTLVRSLPRSRNSCYSLAASSTYVAYTHTQLELTEESVANL